MPTITVKTRNVYGSEMIYPACDQARLLAMLTGKKTLTRDAIRIIKALGYTVTVETPTL